MKRDRFRCTYCGVPGTDAELEVDHIIAVSKGGSHHMSNLTTACRSCNQEKSDGEAPPQVDLNPVVGGARRDGLVGFFLHTLKDGKIQWQGHILATDGDMALVQLFSWLDGGPTEVVAISKATIFEGTKCRMYATSEQMNCRAEKDAEREYREERRQIERERREKAGDSGPRFKLTSFSDIGIGVKPTADGAAQQ